MTMKGPIFKLIWRCLAALALLVVAIPALAQQAVASLDRSTVFDGDSVQLRIAVDQAAPTTEPDYSPLTADFEVSNTGTNTQMSISNGRRQVSTQYTVLLDPLRLGKIVVPSIQVGSLRTQPLTLTVMPRPTGGDQASDLFIEVEATPRNPYVQAQVLYVVRLYHALPITEGALGEPEPESAVIERLGDDNAYETTMNGRRYRVIERRFAIFAERSGQLRIPAISFRGRIADASQGSRFNSLFNRGRRIAVSSEAIDLSVRPQPAEFSGDYWLPAAAMKIREVWPNGEPVFRVGEPATRSIVSEATGLLSAQLPEFQLPPMDTAKVYPDQPEVHSRTDRTWVLGKREDKFAIVPTREGPMVLPEIRIAWWDTQADRERTIVIPAHEFEVLPGTVEITTPGIVIADGSVRPTDRFASGATSGADPLWRKLAALATTLWLLTLWLYVRARRAVPVQRQTDPVVPRQSSNHRKALKQACDRADPQRAASALVAWSGEAYDTPAPGTLRSLAGRLGDNELANEIRQLDRVLYSGADSKWVGQRLWGLCRAGIKPPVAPGPGAQKGVLPPLFKINS
jgi:hypothetical protein